jgi:glutaredoxin-related protein
MSLYKKMTKISLFYSNHCIHCVNFKPEWDKMKSMFKQHNIDYEEFNIETSRDIFEKENIMAYPTIKIEKNDKKYEYTGDRRKESIFKEIGIDQLIFTEDEIKKIYETIDKLIHQKKLSKNSKNRFQKIIDKY